MIYKNIIIYFGVAVISFAAAYFYIEKNVSATKTRNPDEKQIALLNSVQNLERVVTELNHSVSRLNTYIPTQQDTHNPVSNDASVKIENVLADDVADISNDMVEQEIQNKTNNSLSENTSQTPTLEQAQTIDYLNSQLDDPDLRSAITLPGLIGSMNENNLTIPQQKQLLSRTMKMIENGELTTGELFDRNQ